MLVDTHCHLMDPAFDADRAEVLERAAGAGVAAMVMVGYDLATSRAAVALARQQPGVRATVGIHPNVVADTDADDFRALAALAHDPTVVGIGETGLDYYRLRTPPRRQREALDWHLRLAYELELPVIIHNRQADADVAVALEAAAARRSAGSSVGVLHCFSSNDPAYLERMLAAGYVASFAGPLTYKNASELRAMAARVPLDRVLVETDCPYLAPRGQRGRRNEPAFVRETAECLADVHGLLLVDLASKLWANSVRVFPSLAARVEVAA